MNDILKIGGREFTSRLFVGTGKFASNQLMFDSIVASGSQMVTVAMKRIDLEHDERDEMLAHLNRDHVQLLPNTSGVRDAKEAVLAAKLARDVFGTNFIKLEIHPDPKYLLPDPVETLRATEELARDGFVVLPYIQADPVLCKRLEEVGSAAVMPLGAPIGTARNHHRREPRARRCRRRLRRTLTRRRGYGDGRRRRAGQHSHRHRPPAHRDGYRLQGSRRGRTPRPSGRTRKRIRHRHSKFTVNLIS